MKIRNHSLRLNGALLPRNRNGNVNAQRRILSTWLNERSFVRPLRSLTSFVHLFVVALLRCVRCCVRSSVVRRPSSIWIRSKFPDSMFAARSPSLSLSPSRRLSLLASFLALVCSCPCPCSSVGGAGTVAVHWYDSGVCCLRVRVLPSRLRCIVWMMHVIEISHEVLASSSRVRLRRSGNCSVLVGFG